ncbi:hypothetical protein NLI96_g12130 [Meripilus lineatus]|uniref:Uncharacterized protein n=1 Tax=Meripilus lineatus TaxID=2056292 RepID=A0AAD5UQE7_9APHY|nr:hypothetical protein NLI96_g12130 [Physisporinus lineatus]
MSNRRVSTRRTSQAVASSPQTPRGHHTSSNGADPIELLTRALNEVCHIRTSICACQKQGTHTLVNDCIKEVARRVYEGSSESSLSSAPALCGGSSSRRRSSPRTQEWVSTG